MSRAEPPAGMIPPLPVAGPLLAKLAQALSAKTGLDFCQTLVNELAHILGASAVWLTEQVGLDRLRGAGEPRHRRRGTPWATCLPAALSAGPAHPCP